MGLTKIPTKTADSIGAVVRDRPRPLPRDPRYAQSAEEHERLKDTVIELAAAVGLEDGSTSGSLEERVGLLETGGGAGTLTTLDPEAPGDTAPINQNVSAGDTTLANVDSPAGEPADANAPYYLRITDGSNSEHVVVTNRTDPARTIAAPLKFGYSAGPSTVAYAGPATTPAAAGLMPASELHRLEAMETGAQRTDAANVAAAGALMTDGSTAMAAPLDMSGEDIVNAGTVDADVLRMPEEPSDASAEANFVKVYAKDASGVSALYARTDDGAVSKLTGGPETVVDATTARNMATADHAKTVVFTDDTGPNVVTVPDGVKVGTTVEYVQGGDGQVQIAAGGSMVLRHGATFQPRTAEKWSSIVVTVISSTDALVRGDLEAV